MAWFNYSTVNCRGKRNRQKLTAEGHFRLLYVCFSLMKYVNNNFLFRVSTMNMVQVSNRLYDYVTCIYFNDMSLLDVLLGGMSTT